MRAMMSELSQEGNAVYVCDQFDLDYKDRDTAQECGNFCSGQRGCSLEITKKAVYRPR